LSTLPTHTLPRRLARVASSLLATALLALALAPARVAAQPKDNVIDKKGNRPAVLRRDKPEDKPADDKGDDKPEDKPADRGEANNPLDNDTVDIEKNFDPPLGDERPIPGNEKITIDFRKAELEDVVKFYSKLLKKNFIIADSLKAGKKITIIAPRQVSVPEAYRAFLAALGMNGLTLVPHGAFLKIVDSNQAAHEDLPTRTGKGGAPSSDIMETRIIPIEHVSISDIEGVLGKIKSKDADIISYAPTNTLIITEYGTNLRRMFRLINLLDQPTGADKLHLYQVQYADAADLASKLMEIFESDASSNSSASAARRRPGTTTKGATAKAGDIEGGEGSNDVTIKKIIADENTNQLIIIANERSYARIVEIIEKLDVETNAGRIWVYPLQHATAEDLAGVLSGLASGGAQNRRSTAATGSRANRAAAAAAAGGASGGNASSSAGGASLLSGDVQVTAEPATNSLIITASYKDYVAIKTVIEQLDQRRKLVYVEAAIMEISIDRNRRVGIGVNAGLPKKFDFIPSEAADEIGDTGLILGQANFELSKLTQAIQGQGGLGFGIIGPSVSIPGTEFSLPAFLLFLEATQTDQDVNILSTPSILALNNEDAEFSVGERVPFATNTSGLGGLAGLAGLAGLGGAAGGAAGGLGGLGGLGALGGLGGLGAGIDYQDVALSLSLTPQINASGLVRLDVKVTVEDLKPGAGDSLTPTTTKREATTVVVAEDQQTIVIGGLIRDVENEGVTKVPLLGDIPILGWLFRRTNTTVVKQNLVLMLTPYIIDSADDLDRIAQEKQEARARFQELFAQHDKTYMASVNYSHKHGLMEGINRAVRKAESDDETRRRAYGEIEEEENGRKAPADKVKTLDESQPADGGDIIIVPEGKDSDKVKTLENR